MPALACNVLPHMLAKEIMVIVVSIHIQQRSSRWMGYMYSIWHATIKLFRKRWNISCSNVKPWVDHLHNLSLLCSGWCQRLWQDIIQGGYSAKFYTGRLHPEVHHSVTLLYTIFDSKGTWIPFIYLPCKSDTLSLEHCITKLRNFLAFFTIVNSSFGLLKVFFADGKTDFPSLLYTLSGEIHNLPYNYLKPEKGIPSWGSLPA